MTIASRWLEICEQITTTQQQYKVTARNHLVASNYSAAASIVSTIAVSKRQPADFIRQAYAAGARQFGESFLQEALIKIQQLNDLKDITWHFIGPIQSNKTRQIAIHFDWVQSVSREKIARRLSQFRSLEQVPLNTLIQVNISGEASKSGLPPAQLQTFAALVESLPQLNLRGLMCIPTKTQNKQQQLDTFYAMFKLFERTRSQFPKLDTLSMGMSDDYLSAIECGANMVRIGSGLFGLRE